MRVALLALVACTLLTPLAAAQVPLPPVPDPGTAVSAACSAVGGVDGDVQRAIPLCPRTEPAGPQEPAAAHDHGQDPGAPANPQDAPALADDVAGQAQEIPQDPAGAPDHVASIVAAIVQFVKDLVHVPVAASDSTVGAVQGAAASVGAALHGARESVAAAASSAVGSAKAAAGHALEALKTIIPHGAASKGAPARKGALPRAAAPAKQTVDGVLAKVHDVTG